MDLLAIGIGRTGLLCICFEMPENMFSACNTPFGCSPNENRTLGIYLVLAFSRPLLLTTWLHRGCLVFGAALYSGIGVLGRKNSVKEQLELQDYSHMRTLSTT